MTRKDIQKWLEEREITTLLAEGLDDAFIGVDLTSDTPRAVYSIDGCISILSKTMGEDNAEEYFWFNVAGANIGPQTPIFIATYA